MPDVFYTSVRVRGKSLLSRCDLLFDKASFSEIISKRDLVAIKVHFGEYGNTAFLSPIFVRRVVEEVKSLGGKPFLTDANTLYVGARSDAVEHLETAIKNGFTYATVGAPLVIADGLNGKDYVSVEIGGKHFSEVKIGAAAVHADAIIVLSHFKGHEQTGFGGALKNVGMGLGCRSAKQMMHSDVLPKVNLNKCTGDGRCIRWCPTGAISLFDLKGVKKAKIDEKKCIGCGECVVTCREEAIAINWRSDPSAVQEKIVEHAYGVLKNKPGKAGFMNFLINITPDCDCWEWNDAPIVGDIGILASKDPIAIDQASVDLVNREQGIANTRLQKPKAKDKFRAVFPGIDWSMQLAYGEQIGLGSRKYNLIKID
ncbi:DUF362 domain-containing protein [Patescibacteria group bacterium]|nr:DUF362 domain-containing protein [Patescibacteria group bacterium]